MWKPSPWGNVRPKASTVDERSHSYLKPSKPKKDIWNDVSRERIPSVYKKTSPSKARPKNEVEDALGVEWDLRSPASASGRSKSFDVTSSPVRGLNTGYSQSLHSAEEGTDDVHINTKEGDRKLKSSTHYANADNIRSKGVQRPASKQGIKKAKSLATNPQPPKKTLSKQAVPTGSPMYDSGSLLTRSTGERSTQKTTYSQEEPVLVQEDISKTPLSAQLMDMQKMVNETKISDVDEAEYFDSDSYYSDDEFENQNNDDGFYAPFPGSDRAGIPANSPSFTQDEDRETLQYNRAPGKAVLNQSNKKQALAQEESTEQHSSRRSPTTIDQRQRSNSETLPIHFDSDLVIERGEIALVHKIGEGFFGEVWRGKWNGSQDVAVKKMKHDVTSLGDRNTLLSEVFSLSKLRHPNITVFYGVTVPPDALIVSELLKCSLYQLIHNYKNTGDENKPLPLPVVIRILKDVAAGGGYLHRRKPAVIHRDLSSSNVLLSVSPELSDEELLAACADESKPVAKLTDFGLSRNVGWYMTSCVGNLFYLAPEVFSGDHYTQSADVFSFGILMWEIISRESPYEGQNPQRAAYLAATRNLRPSDSSNYDRSPPSLQHIRDQCWHSEPSERPSFTDVLVALNSAQKQNVQMLPGEHRDLTSSVLNATQHHYDSQLSSAPPSTVRDTWNRRRQILSTQLSRRSTLAELIERNIIYRNDLFDKGLPPVSKGKSSKAMKTALRR
mmetsp:Transcript_9941/g.14983  ORF Transcript_9941/g.14983 Transcript_9941/m.14983 type:complete len:727 (-) Transcript_9941:173-2353(-)